MPAAKVAAVFCCTRAQSQSKPEPEPEALQARLSVVAQVEGGC